MTTTLNIPGYCITEQLYAGTRTLVYRGVCTSDQHPVIIKLLRNEFPSFSELVQFRNQYTIAKHLAIPGIIQPYSLDPYHNGYALVMEDFGGTSLRHFTNHRPLSPAIFFAIALQVIDTLHHLHQQRIIHKDIKPANILIHPESQQVKLIDFSIASLLPRETQEIQNPNVLEGTLAYLSPEQTGRMNRGIDYRSDFYSLGVTFFELLTGQLPFQAEDPIEMVHAHLAKQPPDLCDLNPEQPLMLGAIIRKLMAKNAEDRYQSASGLKYDLLKCQEEWHLAGKHSWFDLGQRDVSDRFLIPEKLYGRGQEVETLLEAFGRVANGASELMLVAGFSGIGKTAVVNEVHKPMVRWNSYFIKGKYDQFNRNIPFSAFVQACRDLMGQLLSESDAQLAQWSTKILAAVGENGQVLIDVIPELERILGKQPAPPELSGSAAQHRFNLLFQKFIAVFTTQEHPLVLFLDDLQWADAASLNLIQVLLSQQDIGYLMIIGAYRDNEVFPAHPLMLTIAGLRKANATIGTLTLAPLSLDSLNTLVADTLHCENTIAQPLTELVYQKTQGNPFFATQFLKALHEEAYITYDLQLGHWQCDIVAVRSLSITDDVVEFMALQLQKLPTETQEVLKLAACIGAQFDLNTLAVVSERSPENTAANLWKTLQDGLVLPQSEVYKFFGHRCQTDTDYSEHLSVSSASLSVAYRFLHDRVQQAAYALIPADLRQVTHYKIGQLLLASTPIAAQEANSFEIVRHLNIGASLISDPTLLNQLIQLNLVAGRKAKKSTAHLAAIDYFSKGISLLAPNSWQEQYEITLALHNEIAEAYLLTAQFNQVEEWAKVVLQKAKTVLDTVKIYIARIQACIAQNNLPLAEHTALTILEQLSIKFPENPTEAEVQQALTATQTRFARYDAESLIQLDQMTDPVYLAAMEILVTVVTASHQSVSPLFPLIVCKQIDLSLEHGNSPASASSYSWFGLIQASPSGDLDLCYQAGEVALGLIAARPNDSLKAKTMNITHAFVMHWKRHGRSELQPLLQTHQIGLEAGELEHGAYALYNYTGISLTIGRNLYEMEQETETFDQIIAQLQQGTALCFLRIMRQAVLNLRGKAIDPCRLVGDAYDEAVMLPIHQANREQYAICSIYLNKLILSYLFNDYSQALENAVLAEQNAVALTAALKYTLIYFYSSLTQLALYPTATPTHQADILQNVAAHQGKLQHWLHHAPMNHLHQWHLVEAEKYRVLGYHAEAIEHYDRAIAEAKTSGYIHEEALANELTAKFYLDWGKTRVAQEYMTEAYYGYARWGAKAKIADLEQRYPQLLAPILQQTRVPLSVSETVFIPGITTSTSSSSSSSLDSLDLAAILKASQTLSSEIELDKLLSTLLQTIIQTAGADKCVLMLVEDDCLMVQAFAELSAVEEQGIFQIETHVEQIPQPIQASREVPASLINSVKRSLQPAVITNALQHPQFANDAYIQNHQPKSLLCLPIFHQGKLLGIVYLENNLIVGAFTCDRVELLNLLCAQAAISLENARLYERSQQYSQQLENALKNLQNAQLQMVQSEKMSALGNLVAGVAHEINNPVGFIAGNLQPALDYVKDTFGLLSLYQQEYPQPSPAIQEEIAAIELDYLREDLPKLIHSMKVGIDRIRDISTSLRTFSRSDKDYKVPFNIHDGIDSTILILKHRLKAGSNRPAIDVVRDYGNIPLVECFPGQLNQVFMNILANSIDALEEESHKLSSSGVTGHQKKIEISTQVDESRKQVTIRIWDNGIGMTDEVRQRVFDHLFTTKSVGKGTGLGLAIARQIMIDNHGGEISVNSTWGKGTEFILMLPVKDDHNLGIATSSLPVKDDCSGKNIGTIR